MAHEIEETYAVYNEQIGKGWHKIGLPISGEGTLADQVAKALGVQPILFSDYQKFNAQIVTSDPEFKGGRPYSIKNGGAAKECRIAEIPEVSAIVRMMDGKVMTRTVGKESFGLHQPARLFERAKEILADAPDARLSFAAYLKGGSQLFVCVDMGDVEINGEAHKRHLTLTCGFDGSKSRELIVSVTRVVCDNTLWMARMEVKGEDTEEDDCKAHLKIRNTKHAEKRTDRADGQVAGMLARFGVIQRKLETFPKVAVSDDQAKAIVESCLEAVGMGKSKAKTKGRFKTKMQDILNAYNDPRSDASKWHGTLNGIFQALTDERSNLATVRGGRNADGDVEGQAAAFKRAESRYASAGEHCASYFEIMDAIAEKALTAGSTSGVSLEDVGIHLGEALDGSGEVAAKVV